MAQDRKQIAFYMTQRSAEELDKIQDIFEEKEGKVTKAYVLNQAIYHYYDYIKEYYDIVDEDLQKKD
ncbi:hypothetical protein [Lactococcus lactis]|jgi:hypothetical protein|uniref:hypothetical protein n=1 Tax=Lactococcus lactis TaxID=1358 RepID=UPI00240E418F|nr:hypothetical protein [Lactococcus lactis]WFB95373.1 hypothetical protein PDI73_08240 [Lactococcus lactis]